MKKENIKRAFITVGLIGILAASPVMAEVSRLSVPSVGDTVEIFRENDVFFGTRDGERCFEAEVGFEQR